MIVKPTRITERTQDFIRESNVNLHCFWALFILPVNCASLAYFPVALLIFTNTSPYFMLLPQIMFCSFLRFAVIQGKKKAEI